MKKRRKGNLKGDMLRELILFVYLNNKYDREKNKISWLKERLGYSTGGLYNALDESGYFERKNDEIRLTEKGTDYLNRQLLPQYTVFNSMGDFLMILGFVFLLQWYLWTYAHIPMIPEWYPGVAAFATGVVIRFSVLRIVHWIISRNKEVQ